MPGQNVLTHMTEYSRCLVVQGSPKSSAHAFTQLTLSGKLQEAFFWIFFVHGNEASGLCKVEGYNLTRHGTFQHNISPVW